MPSPNKPAWLRESEITGIHSIRSLWVPAVKHSKVRVTSFRLTLRSTQTDLGLTIIGTKKNSPKVLVSSITAFATQVRVWARAVWIGDLIPSATAQMKLSLNKSGKTHRRSNQPHKGYLNRFCWTLNVTTIRHRSGGEAMRQTTALVSYVTFLFSSATI